MSGPAREIMIERLLRRIEAPASYDDCIPWLGAKTKAGYGNLGSTTAHRIAYALFVSDLPANSRRFTVDHLCRNPGCVNPFHLELVPQAENARRGKGSATHCKHGHEFTPENTINEPRGNRSGVIHRRCRTCKKARLKASDARFLEAGRNLCVDCGKAISRYSIRCLSCAAIDREAHRTAPTLDYGPQP